VRPHVSECSARAPAADIDPFTSAIHFCYHCIVVFSVVAADGGHVVAESTDRYFEVAIIGDGIDLLSTEFNSPR